MENLLNGKKWEGTLNSEIERIWSLGKCVIFDLDVRVGMNLIGDKEFL